jgi:8-oxo-dGTP diphosphatase
MISVMSAPLTPLIAADILIELTDQPARPIVLIERRNPPYGWAIPGGFVDIGESVEAAAIREAEEETGLRVRLTALLGVYSDPHRDPRGHTVSAVYVAEAVGEPRAQDDAKALVVVSPDRAPAPLAFDHAQILADYRVYRQTGRLPAPRVNR